MQYNCSLKQIASSTEAIMDNAAESTIGRLLDKASEAFVLAIELYNRPSIRYRVEGFAFFICNAWELMLKAKIIKDRGMDAVYYKDNPKRTISIENCISIVFTNDKDPLRKNLEDIIRLRNTSTHFIVEEYEQIYVGLFQSCVSNFDDKMYEFHGRRMGDVVPPHFLMLSMTASPATPETIRTKYPASIAEKFLFDENEIVQEQLLQSNQRYASVMLTELAVVRDSKKADFTVAYDASSDRPMRTAKVFRDPSTTHPLSVNKLVAHVNKALRKRGIVLCAAGEEKEFTTNDWKLFLNFYDLKSRAEFAYPHNIGNTTSYTYSMRTVDFIVGQIAEGPETVIDSLKQALRDKKRDDPRGKGF